MNLGLTVTLAFMLFLFAAAVALVAGIIYLDARDSGPDPAPPTPSSTTTSTSVTSSSTIPTPTTVTTSTTSTTLPGILSIEYFPEVIYRLDDVVLSVEADGEPVTGAEVYVNSELSGGTRNGAYTMVSLSGGYYQVFVAHPGYENASISFTVDERTYATSKDVRERMTQSERAQAIADGKASVRFFDSPGCSICAAVRPKLDKLVDDNRQCIAYEKLSFLRYRTEEGLGSGSLPFIVVEGSRGRFIVNGLVSMSRISDLIERSSGCILE